MNKKVVTFGEIMLRLAPEGYYRFVQADKYTAVYGGAEANVSVSLANFGINSVFVTKLPNHEIGQAAVNMLRRYGVDTSYIVRGGSRIGIYYMEKGFNKRPSKVIYDRAGSSIAEAASDDFDWEKIFEGADWFHFTGITPALGDNLASICLDACKTAKRKNVTVSCDLNYRQKLWSIEKAGKVMSELCQYVDVLITNEQQARDLFGIKYDYSDVSSEEINKEACIDLARQLTKRFNFSKTAITVRRTLSANENAWSAMLYDGICGYFGNRYMIQIVDRVGGGDAFATGLIYSLLNNYDPQEAINFATAAGCLKHSIEGDFNLVSVDEVKLLASGDTVGNVQR